MMTSAWSRRKDFRRSSRCFQDFQRRRRESYSYRLFEVVVTSATPLNSALLLLPLIVDFGDGIEGGKQLVDRAAVLDVDAADAVDGVRHQCRSVPSITRLFVVIHLHAGFGTERIDRAGRAGGAGVNGHREGGEFKASLGFREVGYIGRDHSRSRVLDRNGLRGEPT